MQMLERHLKEMGQIPSGKLTWQWKISIFNREYIFRRAIFYCHVSLLEGKFLVPKNILRFAPFSFFFLGRGRGWPFWHVSLFLVFHEELLPSQPQADGRSFTFFLGGEEEGWLFLGFHLQKRNGVRLHNIFVPFCFTQKALDLRVGGISLVPYKFRYIYIIYIYMIIYLHTIFQ